MEPKKSEQRKRLRANKWQLIYLAHFIKNLEPNNNNKIRPKHKFWSKDDDFKFNCKQMQPRTIIILD